MKRLHLLTSLLAGAFLVLASQSFLAGGPPRARADGDEDRAEGRIGFIDLKKVFESYGRTKEWEKEINDHYRTRKQELQKRTEELKEEKRLLESHSAPGSPEGRAKEKEIALAQFQIEFEGKWEEEQAQQKLQRATENLYTEILGKVATYAEEKGYRAILKIDEEEIGSFTQSELKLKIHTRTVLYSRKADDLTQAVVEYLNH